MTSDLQAWTLPKGRDVPKIQRYEGLRDGGGSLVERPVLRWKHAEAEQNGDRSMRVRFDKDGGFLEADVVALGFPDDWSAISALEMACENGPDPLTLELTLLGARGRYRTRRMLSPGEKTSLRLEIPDLPLAQGIQPPWQPSAIRISAQWGATWETEGQLIEAGCTWGATKDNAPVTFHLREVRTHPRANGNPPVLVDRFGQRVHGDWPGKVRSEDDLARHLQKEALMDPVLPPESFSRFRGRKDLPRHTPSGFFRVERDEKGVWWFIDPEGYRFWSVGSTGVRLLDTTVITGREEFFEELPDPAGPFASVRNPRVNSPANNAGGRETVAFYMWNVLRKYGSAPVWRDQVLNRFRSWGFNTLGNWSELDHFADAEFPFTVTLDTRRPEVKKLRGNLPDVHDPLWEPAFEAHVREVTARWRDNPFVLGYFVDNEMGWRNLEEAEMEAYAEKYFSTVSRVIKAHDPNHLYLGCRFIRMKPHSVICAAAGRHCDVVTVNSYDLWPRREEFGPWHEETGRPILIGEHHVPLDCAQQVPPLYPAFTEPERERLYQELVEKWASQPWSLGCHWYQHADQHPTGRPLDGENQPVGMVDITDTPHPEMVRAARAATARMWDVHANAK